MASDMQLVLTVKSLRKRAVLATLTFGVGCGGWLSVHLES
jgi:hypothetical protein